MFILNAFNSGGFGRQFADSFDKGLSTGASLFTSMAQMQANQIAQKQQQGNLLQSRISDLTNKASDAKNKNDFASWRAYESQRQQAQNELNNLWRSDSPSANNAPTQPNVMNRGVDFGKRVINAITPGQVFKPQPQTTVPTQEEVALPPPVEMDDPISKAEREAQDAELNAKSAFDRSIQSLPPGLRQQSQPLQELINTKQLTYQQALEKLPKAEYAKGDSEDILRNAKSRLDTIREYASNANPQALGPGKYGDTEFFGLKIPGRVDAAQYWSGVKVPFHKELQSLTGQDLRLGPTPSKEELDLGDIYEKLGLQEGIQALGGKTPKEGTIQRVFKDVPTPNQGVDTFNTEFKGYSRKALKDYESTLSSIGEQFLIPEEYKKTLDEYKNDPAIQKYLRDETGKVNLNKSSQPVPVGQKKILKSNRLQAQDMIAPSIDVGSKKILKTKPSTPKENDSMFSDFGSFFKEKGRPAAKGNIEVKTKDGAVISIPASMQDQFSDVIKSNKVLKKSEVPKNSRFLMELEPTEDNAMKLAQTIKKHRSKVLNSDIIAGIDNPGTLMLLNRALDLIESEYA